jgi:hypothetical protein
MPRTRSTESHTLPLRRRFAGVIDENGEPFIGWGVDTRGEWMKDWPPCPDGDPIELRHALGFRERSIRELELRVLLGGDDRGVCQVIVDERDDEVHVRVLVHQPNEGQRVTPGDREYLDWPVRVSLVRPLGNRPVIDMDSDDELPPYAPEYLDNELKPDHECQPTARRR